MFVHDQIWFALGSGSPPTKCPYHLNRSNRYKPNGLFARFALWLPPDVEHSTKLALAIMRILASKSLPAPRVTVIYLRKGVKWTEGMDKCPLSREPASAR